MHYPSQVLTPVMPVSAGPAGRLTDLATDHCGRGRGVLAPAHPTAPSGPRAQAPTRLGMLLAAAARPDEK
ncbi:hypothetical protein DMH25_07865 [Streptomyces sp. WAC 01325]|uniref:hypothetical protein n=1 Tax=Streptomyces sp. WAC 01325 TaxID=2203202 RepID=UPI000F85ED19|nr:hypothetical protein [Streptomyces sp. WAC 01325]RSN14842.1 hypothetical protein DMH25_07865 [Streptomyces sp. WAC 01325]